MAVSQNFDRIRDSAIQNCRLGRQDFGHVCTRFPFRYMVDSREYEKEARESEKGVTPVYDVLHVCILFMLGFDGFKGIKWMDLPSFSR